MKSMVRGNGEDRDKRSGSGNTEFQNRSKVQKLELGIEK